MCFEILHCELSISIYTSILKIEFNIRSSIFDLQSRLKSGSGETWARPKVTDNISAKDAVLPAVNEKFNTEYFAVVKYLAVVFDVESYRSGQCRGWPCL